MGSEQQTFKELVQEKIFFDYLVPVEFRFTEDEAREILEISLAIIDIKEKAVTLTTSYYCKISNLNDYAILHTLSEQMKTDMESAASVEDTVKSLDLVLEEKILSKNKTFSFVTLGQQLRSVLKKDIFLTDKFILNDYYKSFFEITNELNKFLTLNQSLQKKVLIKQNLNEILNNLNVEKILFDPNASASLNIVLQINEICLALMARFEDFVNDRGAEKDIDVTIGVPFLDPYNLQDELISFEKEQSKILLLSGLPDIVQNREIENFFSSNSVEGVKDILMLKLTNNTPSGCAFVELNDHENAKKSLNLCGKLFQSCTLIIIPSSVKELKSFDPLLCKFSEVTEKKDAVSLKRENCTNEEGSNKRLKGELEHENSTVGVPIEKIISSDSVDVNVLATTSNNTISAAPAATSYSPTFASTNSVRPTFPPVPPTHASYSTPTALQPPAPPLQQTQYHPHTHSHHTQAKHQPDYSSYYAQYYAQYGSQPYPTSSRNPVHVPHQNSYGPPGYQQPYVRPNMGQPQHPYYPPQPQAGATQHYGSQAYQYPYGQQQAYQYPYGHPGFAPGVDKKKKPDNYDNKTYSSANPIWCNTHFFCGHESAECKFPGKDHYLPNENNKYTKDYKRLQLALKHGSNFRPEMLQKSATTRPVNQTYQPSTFSGRPNYNYRP
ncbi:hypothetical protein HK099_004047 [Clydaea vesicula]|uniref:RRM domain-containing protein n=1 Tax=Clydaea vesicula TaxID=447962 RepID=A0AAD5U0Q6_9FUNG|nr:hypothetical protein HK099_004047 [Clydaea vesicula]KAJ3394533.1 hypothetical protein HDU92_006809 [Lobulomyces angularis]